MTASILPTVPWAFCPASMGDLVRCDTDPNITMVTASSSPALIRRASQMALKMFGRSFSEAAAAAPRKQDHISSGGRQQKIDHINHHHGNISGGVGGKVKFTIDWSEDELSDPGGEEGGGVETDGVTFFKRGRGSAIQQVI